MSALRSSKLLLLVALGALLGTSTWSASTAQAQAFPRYTPPSEDETPSEEFSEDEAGQVEDEPVPEDEPASDPSDASDTGSDEAASEDIGQETGEVVDETPGDEEPSIGEPDEGGEPTDLEPEPEAGASLDVHVAVGGGVGTLELLSPVVEGSQKLPRSSFAAADFQLRLHAWPHEAFSLDFMLVYETSLALQLTVEPLFGLNQTVSVRAQRVELSAAPTFRLADSPSALSLAFPLGFVLRTLVPEQHQYQMPEYVMLGLQLRAELVAPLGETVRVRIGPETQWVAFVDSPLNDLGAGSGLAFGGQASIEADVGEIVRVSLVYREARTFLPASDARYEDTERYLTARIGAEL
jgi:hypothetical protein